MSKIIASTYELLEEIGSGGGGIVYLGRHLRLDKEVVLKADKRTISTDPEVLRREVDALKNLSHTYIPQVYDFVVQGETVYTVMDFIEGESLDRPLKEGRRFPQPQVIEWACQLLDALRYLHSRPPHGILHSDIKPANIMLTPQGDIRLIDFNIALALGADGSVRVGYSRGYASPEHYGLDYTRTGSLTRSGTTQTGGTFPTREAVTGQVIIPGSLPPRADETETVPTEQPQKPTDILVQGPGVPPTELTEVLSSPAGSTEITEVTDGTEVLDSSSPSSPGAPQPPRPAAPTPPSGASSQTGGKKTVMLDVRSDIYSLGATLYHLFSGIRPAANAREVMPIQVPGVSPAVSAIIQKAMAPNPDDRYQTAQEMLDAFEHLHDNDIRTIRHKRRVKLTAGILVCLFLAGGLCSFTGLRQMEQAEQAARVQAEQSEAEQRAAKQALAAVGESETAYRQGNLPLAVQRAMDALSLDSPYTAQAQKALTDALGVYDLSDGFRAERTLELPSEPLRLVLSPGGTRLAALYAFQADIFDLETGDTLAQLPLENSALSELLFLDDNRLFFAGEGAVTAYDLSAGQTLWTGQAGTALALSGDGKRLAALYKDESQARIYDAASGTLLQTLSFQGQSQRVLANDILTDPNDDLFLLNETGSMLAVSFSDGTLVLFDLNSGERLDLLESSPDSIFEGGFYKNYLAFSSWDGTESIFAAVDTDQMIQTSGFSATTPFHVQADSRGIYLSLDNLMVQLDPATGEQTELAYHDKDITNFCSQGGYTLASLKENTCAVFDGKSRVLSQFTLDRACDFMDISGDWAVIASRDDPSVRLLKRENHQDAQLFSYDPAYSHQEARLSADGSTVMMFSADDFRIYSRDSGALLAEEKIPDAAQLYDPQFRRDEDGTSYLELLYNDGTVRCFSAKDGSLIDEYKVDTPDETLYEEFYTDNWRITAPLHEAPAAYDLDTGELITTLEQDAYLTYVTQVGDCVITEYVSAQGERYGLLLDEQCQVLARLPYLCDIIGDTLVFDYPSGDLRQCRIYSLQELMALAE